MKSNDGNRFIFSITASKTSAPLDSGIIVTTTSEILGNVCIRTFIPTTSLLKQSYEISVREFFFEFYRLLITLFACILRSFGERGRDPDFIFELIDKSYFYDKPYASFGSSLNIIALEFIPCLAITG